MNSLKRPKRGETEEDLLRQQNNFLTTNKIQKVDNKSIEQNNEDIIADNHDLPHIMTRVVEKNINSLDSFSFESNFITSSNGFPKAVRRSDNLVAKSGKSLFAQQMEQKMNKKQNNCENYVQKSSEDKGGESVVIGMGLGTDDWKTDINNIRKENALLMEKMDTNEILEMKTEIMSKLNPKTIDFLINKRFLNKNKPKIEKSIDVDMNEVNHKNDNLIHENDLPIKQTEVMDNKWLNMDVVEREKMSWMGDIKDQNQTNQLVSSTQPTISARFDFDANLIDNSREIDVHLGLHHHRLDESSPGYTIQELYTLIQSSFSSQKVIGLKLLSKILMKAFNGLFDNCFNENIVEQLLKNSALILVTRKCLDDNTETVWKIAINALHSMLCNTIVDELFLDRGFTLFNDCLKIDSNSEDLMPSYDSTKLDQLSDEQLLGLDVIKCLVERTSLLQRIRYILSFNKSQLESKSVNDLMDILIRIARHSSDSRQAIIRCPYLLEAIVENFIPVSIGVTNNVLDKPNAKALKVIRLLVSSDSQIIHEIITPFPQIIDAIKVYLTINPENCENSSEVLQLSIESLRLWINLLSQKVFISDFLDMFPIVIKQLQYCLTLDPIRHQNNYDFQYASTLIFLVKNLVENTKDFKAFNDLIFMILMKWLTIVKNEVIVPNFDSSLCILSAIELLLMSRFNTESVYDIVNQIIDSQNFVNKLMNALINNSNLIKLNAQKQGNQRDSSNLPSFGSIYFENLDNVFILNNDSPVCLVLAFIRVIKTSCVEKFVNKLNGFKDYIFKVSKNLKFGIKLSFFDFYELNLLNEICLLCSSLTSIGNQDINCYLNLSILMICFLKNNGIKQNLLNEIVFNEAIHCNKIIENIEKLSLNENFGNNLVICEPKVECFDTIKVLYKKYSNFDCFHWIFDPLISFVKNKNSNEKEVFDCLSFIGLIVKNNRSVLNQLINSSTLFCLISSIFLISEEIFFNNSVQNVLYFILKRLLLDGIKCRIEDRIPYFETTGDFFVRFLEQFESVSYGNKLFTNYLLVFCQNTSSSLFRTKLMSEYTTALRIINIDFKEILIPIENFLFPIETDTKTLESYLKSLLCGSLNPKESPILYLIAIHNLNHNLFRSKDITTEKQSFVRLIRSVHNSSNDLLKLHLLKYSHFDANQTYGISLT